MTLSGNFARYIQIGKRILWQHSMKDLKFEYELIKEPSHLGTDADEIVLPSSTVHRKDLTLKKEDKLEDAQKYSPSNPGSTTS